MLEVVLHMLETENDVRHVLCATCPWKVRWRLDVVFYALGMLEGVRRVLLFTLEVVEGELCLLGVLKVLEVMRCVLLRMLETGG
jgi:hypothetical protein